MGLKTKKAAEREAKRLLVKIRNDKRLRSENWEVRIWENFGWHIAFYNGPIALYAHHRENKNGNIAFDNWSALLSDTLTGGAGLGFWTPEDTTAMTPGEAVERVVLTAKKELDRLNGVVGYARFVIKDIPEE